MNLEAWIRKTGWRSTHLHREVLECEDGFKMSVQAGKTFLSKPDRCFQVGGDYTHYEILFPTEECPELKEYEYQENVYAYVPKAVVNKIINRHGGIKE